jgi:hypothetical protein
MRMLLNKRSGEKIAISDIKFMKLGIQIKAYSEMSKKQ